MLLQTRDVELFCFNISPDMFEGSAIKINCTNIYSVYSDSKSLKTMQLTVFSAINLVCYCVIQVYVANNTTKFSLVLH